MFDGNGRVGLAGSRQRGFAPIDLGMVRGGGNEAAVCDTTIHTVNVGDGGWLLFMDQDHHDDGNGPGIIGVEKSENTGSVNGEDAVLEREARGGREEQR